MKKVICLSSMKSRCFMLLTCLILLVGVTSCSSDDFETNLPEEPKQLSKAELIQQALSRMPKTRSTEPNLVIMTTIKKAVTIRGTLTDSVKIQWDKDKTTSVYGPNMSVSYTFTDDNLSHYIRIMGSEQAIKSLDLDNNELISLDVSGNTNLMSLTCKGNHLGAIDLTACSNLGTLNISNNEFSTIDITGLPVYFFYAENNQLTELDVSQNLNLSDLALGNNQLTELNISKNQNLSTLEVENNQLTNLDLFNCPDIIILNVSFNPITDLNINNSTYLMYLYLERVPLKTLNNQPLCDLSFAIYPQLMGLSVAYTPFESLNLSYNPILVDVDISGSSIAQLNMLDGIIGHLNATRSKLRNLVYTSNSLENLYEVRIESTPFEKDWKILKPFVENLPSRNGIASGHFYTYSENIDKIASIITQYNWFINN